MRIEVKLPQLSMGMSDAEVIEWMVAEGDAVEEGQEIVEIEAEKARTGVPSPAAGKVVEIVAQPEDTVEVQEVLCHLETDG
ncbi:MAG TPA: biotin/lipoyl-containing protein [Solirubrobacterales bacterium]|jgi:pyruvate/2-oxoglutarate dehydrogenase complex dihydrolipoamide acyltransferase (E2) component|nr:biotin/lipoyl-containing protein [Solirubrobacterales bacterium]